MITYTDTSYLNLNNFNLIKYKSIVYIYIKVLL